MASIILRQQVNIFRSFKNSTKGVVAKDKEGANSSKLFIAKVQERNQRWKEVKLAETPEDRELGRKWNEKMWQLERETQLEFRKKLHLKLEAIDALPAELREHVFEVDTTPLPPGFNAVRSPWPYWLEDAANEI